MTTEIAILNRTAVALAADSAVTVGSQQPGDPVKVYNSANKLFALSKYHPVGLMIYGNAEFVGIPWETIVKVYREQLSSRENDRLDEYASDFITFVEQGAEEFFPPSQQENYVRGKALEHCRRLIDDVNPQLYAAYEEGRQLSDDEKRLIVTDAAKSILGQSLAKPFIAGFDEAFVTLADDVYGDVIGQAIDSSFAEDWVTPEARLLLRQTTTEGLPRAGFGPSHSGVVIAGFGKKNLFPALRCFLFDGVALNRLICEKQDGRCFDVEFSNTSVVVPFAQDDMVCLFMEGIDRDYHRFLRNLVSGTVAGVSSVVAQALSDCLEGDTTTLQQDLDVKIKQLINTFDEESRNYMREQHVKPIIEIVSLMSKDELAVMAETLVNLTVFKRRITPTPETVGGPVDVAVISRGDGFVWIKRKHYFDAHLNHQFFANYFVPHGD